MNSFKDVMNLWPSFQALADDLSENLYAVRKWHSRNSIPSNKWLSLITAAKKRRFKAVTLELLAQLADAKAA